jgi:hypothetical protein
MKNQNVNLEIDKVKNDKRKNKINSINFSFIILVFGLMSCFQQNETGKNISNNTKDKKEGKMQNNSEQFKINVQLMNKWTS